MDVLASLRGLLLGWLRPSGARSRAGTSAPLTMLWHVSGWLQLLLWTGAQPTLGQREASSARRRCVGLPAGLVSALAVGPGSRPFHPIASWLMHQLGIYSGLTAGAAAVYMVTTERSVYVGYSAA